jgi:diguanylate cyclase (GGDEF)-like protein
MFDLDLFKSINDAHGHACGDLVLRAVSDRVLEVIRREDTFARYGGEEFVILVRGLTEEGVVRLAERIRKAVEVLRIFVDSGTIGVTISLGIATTKECTGELSQASLFALADQRLYLAKDLGRNQVCSAHPPLMTARASS